MLCIKSNEQKYNKIHRMQRNNKMQQQMALYNQCVGNVKQIKCSNDRINKQIGIKGHQHIQTDVQAEKLVIDKLYNKTMQILESVEKGYLNPDIARRFTVVRQQLQVQAQRRKQLIQNLSMPTNIKSNYTIKKAQTIENTQQKQRFTKLADKQRERRMSGASTSISMSLEPQLHYQQAYINERSIQLQKAHKKIIDINRIMKQSEIIANTQGLKLNSIGSDLEFGKDKVYDGVQQLQKTNKTHRKIQRKYYLFGLLALIVAACVMLYVLL